MVDESRQVENGSLRIKITAVFLARSVPGRGAPFGWAGFSGDLVEKYVEAVGRADKVNERSRKG